MRHFSNIVLLLIGVDDGTATAAAAFQRARPAAASRGARAMHRAQPIRAGIPGRHRRATRIAPRTGIERGSALAFRALPCGSPHPAAIATPPGAPYIAVMPRSLRLRLACALPALAALAACAKQSAEAVSAAPGAPGFLYGLWHGFIFPVAWLLSLFSERVAVYAVPNNGGWYDFGYFLGIVVFGVGARSGTRTVYRTVYVDRRRLP